MRLDYKFEFPIQGTLSNETFITERENIQYSKFCEQLVSVKPSKTNHFKSSLHSVNGVKKITDHETGCQRLIFIN